MKSRSEVDVPQLIADIDEEIERIQRGLRESDRASISQIVDERVVAARMAARRSRLAELKAERATLYALLPEEER